ncbi:MAG TPA: hypothetical protein VFH43_13270 [Candidatus Kapabacteria bacterium]|nr:hypothetical protein [Candidatus Kapabacteria bacterium]
MRSRSIANSVLPVIIGLLCFALFRLALHNPSDARLFSYLDSERIVTATEFNGVYVLLLAKLLNAVTSAELTIRIITALAAGLSAAIAIRLLSDATSLRPLYLAANISFLYFASHSAVAMATLCWFSIVMWILMRKRSLTYESAALVAALGLGIDSLLAVAVTLYVVLRAMLDADTDKLRVTVSLLLGVGVWLLLAYMLYGAAGFVTAILSGFDGLFDQVNPIHFGVGLLTTFNILLIWIFSSPTVKTRIMYLGSTLIVAMLFVKVEPHYLLVLLFAGLMYLHLTDAMPRHKWVLPVYAGLNLLAFFALPALGPKEANYNVRGTRLGEAEAYYSDHFAKHLPSYQALVSRANDLKSLIDLYARNKADQAVILDPATEVSFQAAALRGLHEHPVGSYRPDLRRFQNAFDRDTSIKQLLSAPVAHYVATEARPIAIDSALRVWRSPRVDVGSLELYAIDSTYYQDFFDLYIYNHYLSYH